MRGGWRGDRRASLVLFVLFCMLSLLPATSATIPARTVVQDGAAHAPILIEGDGDFTPPNGVVGGSGTPADPFIIAGWEMLLTGPPGIEIRNTSAYFVIRDVVLIGSVDGAFDGVILRHVANARVENVTSEHNRIGILLDAGQSVAISQNRLLGNRRGIHVFSSTHVAISRNNATGGPIGEIHVLVMNSQQVAIESNRIFPTYGAAIGAALDTGLQIVNNTVQSLDDGILFDNVTDASVADNDFSWYRDVGFSALGFRIHSSENVSLTANTFRDYGGHLLEQSANITITGNRFPGYLYGLALRSSRGMTLSNNSMDRGGLWIEGLDLLDFNSHHIDSTNEVGGRPIAYYRDCADVSLDGTATAQVIVANCQRVHLVNLSFAHVAVGAQFVYSQNVSVNRSNMVDVTEGVRAEASANLSVMQNNMTLGAFGIHILGTSGFILGGNRIWNYPQEIDVESSTNGEALGNTLTGSSNVGLAVSFSARLVLSGNNVSGNNWGIGVGESTEVVIERNEVAQNHVGISLGSSQGIRAHHNDFLGNDVQARDESGATNQWDDGYPSGGNYWSNYNGWDDCGGPAQDVCPGSDGLGDIPYSIAAGVQDRYPLVPVNPMNKLPLAEFSYTPSSIGPGISVTVDASASYDPEGWPLRYHWEFGDGSAANTTSTSIQHTYSASQTFVVTLTVTDVRGGMSSQSQALKVGFAPVALFTLSPSHPVAGEDIQFDASTSYDPDGTILSYAWSFGDGTSASNIVVFPRAYSSPGAYLVELVVTDDSGITSSVSHTIDVVPPSPLVLVPYNHASGFSLPIPKDWTVEENRVVNGSTIELILYGPTRQVRTNIIVDTDLDASVRETTAYLLDAVNATVREARLNTGEQGQITQGPDFRSIGGHAGVTFKLGYGASTLIQEFAIVVSEAHHRYWVLVLTTDEPSFAIMDEAFGRMINGFEITAPIPPPPLPSPVFPLGMITAAGAIIGATIAVLIVVRVRSRSKRMAPPPTVVPGAATASGPQTSSPRLCRNCGSPVSPAGLFCGVCGNRLG